MIEGSGGTSFLLEPVQAILIGRETGGQNFHRDVTTKFRVARPIYFTHSARAELRADFISAEFCTCVDRHTARWLIADWDRTNSNENESKVKNSITCWF